MSKWWYYVTGAISSIIFLVVAPIGFKGISVNKKEQEKELRIVFDDYLKIYNKSYPDPKEHETRFAIFMATLDDIQQMNQDSRGPYDSGAIFGITKFADLSKNEFKKLHLSDEKIRKRPQSYGRLWNRLKDNLHKTMYKTVQDDKLEETPKNGGQVYMRKKRADIPLEVDWRTKGVISSVKQQGKCGACWAFSTVSTIEAMAAINTGKLQEFSVQEMIDCARSGNYGCAGGDICQLLDWLVMTDTRVLPDDTYPLRLMDGKCEVNKNATTGVRVNRFTCDDMVGNEQKLLEMIAVHGPVTVAVNALSWQHYLGGVLQYNCCGTLGELNHAVQLVGYNVKAEVPYYIAKNSWGVDFGEEGYVKIAIGNNICGLALEVASLDVIV